MSKAFILNHLSGAKLALRSLRGEAIPTDGGQQMLVSPCNCIRVRIKRQVEQLGCVPLLQAHAVKTKQHVPASDPAGLSVPVGTEGGFRCLPTHSQPYRM